MGLLLFQVDFVEQSGQFVGGREIEGFGGFIGEGGECVGQ